MKKVDLGGDALVYPGGGDARLRGFADDTNLAAGSVAGLQALADAATQWAVRSGVRFGPHKCRVTTLGAGQEQFTVQVQGGDVPWVAEVESLGVRFSARSHSGAKGVHPRVISLKGAMPSWRRIVEPKGGVPVVIAAKVLLPKVRPTLLYGCEVYPK